MDRTGSSEDLAEAGVDVTFDVDFRDDVFWGKKASSSSSLKSISMTSGSFTIGPFFEAAELLIGVILISGGVGVEGFMAIFPMPRLSLVLAVLVTVLLLPLLGVLLLDPSETVLFGEFLAAFVRALVNRDLADTLLGWFVEPDPESRK